MQEHFGMFNQFITKYVKFTEAELADLNEKCTKVYFSKGALIMKAGEIQNNLYLLYIQQHFSNLNNQIPISLILILLYFYKTSEEVKWQVKERSTRARLIL